MKSIYFLFTLVISFVGNTQTDTNVFYLNPQVLEELRSSPYPNSSPPLKVKKGQHQYEVIGETFSRYDIKDGWFSDSMNISPGGTSHRFFNPYLQTYGQKDKNYRDGTYRFFHYTNGYLTQGHHKLQNRELYGEDFFEGDFVNGVTEGFFTAYSEDDRSYMCGNMKNGEIVGELKYYRKSPDNPHLIYTFRAGEAHAHSLKRYDQNTGKITAFITRINSYTDSLVVTFNGEGDTLSILELTNPEEKIYSYKEWYPSGQLKIEGAQKKSSSVSYEKTGTWIYYNEDGSLAEKKEFK